MDVLLNAEDRNRFEQFFIRNGDQEKSSAEKILILLHIAETHQNRGGEHVSGTTPPSKRTRYHNTRSGGSYQYHQHSSSSKSVKDAFVQVDTDELNGRKHLGCEADTGDPCRSAESGLEEQPPPKDRPTRRLQRKQWSQNNAYLKDLIEASYADDPWPDGYSTRKPRPRGSPTTQANAANEQLTDDRQYANSPSYHRLLPENYYSEWSEGKQCRLVAGEDGTRNALQFVESKKFIVDFAQLLKLISPKCYQVDCTALNDFSTKGLKIQQSGAALTLTIQCNGKLRHEKIWYTSQLLKHNHIPRGLFYAINVLLPSAIVISGNEWTKMELLFEMLHIQSVSHTIYTTNQSGILAPAIRSAYDHMQRKLGETMKARNLKAVIASDGQFDCPGKFAAYYTMTNMIAATIETTQNGVEKEQKSEYVASVEMVERRHCDSKIAPMEVAGFLLGLMQVAATMEIPVKEVLTADHNAYIVQLVALAKNDPEEFIIQTKQILRNFKQFADNDSCHILLRAICADIDHALDVSDRAQAIGQALGKLSVAPQERKNYLQWIQAAKSHFFTVCKSCKGDQDTFRNQWLSILDRCRADRPLLWKMSLQLARLQPSSKAFVNMQTVVRDPKLLRDIPYYVTARHISCLESFNAMNLTYGPKRGSNSWTLALVRKYLAVLEWNNSAHRPNPRQDQDGEAAVGKTPEDKQCVGKRSAGNPTKAPVDRHYLPHLLAMCLHERCTTEVRLTIRRNKVGPIFPDDPKLLSPAENADQLKRHYYITDLLSQAR